MSSIIPQATLSLSLSLSPSLSLLLSLSLPPPPLGKTKVAMRNLCFAGPALPCPALYPVPCTLNPAILRINTLNAETLH